MQRVIHYLIFPFPPQTCWWPVVYEVQMQTNCGMDTCSCTIRFEIEEPCMKDTCLCEGFNNMAFHSQGIPSWALEATCNNKTVIPLPCLPRNGRYEFSGEMPCMDTCGTDVEYEIISGTGASILIGTATTAGPDNQFNIPGFSYTIFPGAGNYKLLLKGFCQFDTCECVINFSVPACFSFVHGVVYADLECKAKAYSDQPTLPGWTIDLLNVQGNVLETVVTDAWGAYSFDNLPPGEYAVRTTLEDKWEFSVPSDGIRSFNIENADTMPEPQTVFLPFGFCSVCSCNDIQISVGNYDGCCYYLDVQNNGAYCFSKVIVSLDAGQIINIIPNGWSTQLIDPNHLALIPPGGYIPAGATYPVQFCVDGNANPVFDLETSYVDNGQVISCNTNTQSTCSQDCAYTCEDNTLWNGIQNISSVYDMIEFNGNFIMAGVFDQIGSQTGFNNIAAWDGTSILH